MALLQRWGLPGKLTAAGTPPARRVRFDAGGGLVMNGRFPAYEGVDALYSPRRTLLDSILVEAAREAGAEVRENFRVTQVTASGSQVTGIRGSARGRPEVTETANLVIGADGKRSLVAGAVGARQYRERPVRSFASYTYWAGVPLSGGELYQRPGRAVAVFPTNDELTMVYAAAPMTEFASARADLEGHYLRTLDLCGDLGERVRSGSRAERLRTTPDQPNTFRSSHGPGWALAGDAGVVMDSISAQGMTNALRDASYLSAAVVAGLDGSRPLADALHDHQCRRDRAILGSYDFTLGLAAFPPARPGQRHFLAAVAADQQETDRFLGAFAGIVPPEDYFTFGTVVRILGSRGIRKLTTATANHLFSGLRHRDPARQAGAGGHRRAVPGWWPRLPAARKTPRPDLAPCRDATAPLPGARRGITDCPVTLSWSRVVTGGIVPTCDIRWSARAPPLRHPARIGQSVAMENGELTGSVSMPGVVVRDYASADYSACRMLWVELTEHHRRIYEDPSIGGDDPGGAFDDYLAVPERVASWVADLNGWVVGLTGLFDRGTSGEVEPVVVTDRLRSRGVGRLLIERVVTEAVARGYEYLAIRPVARNVSAIRSFYDAGFQTLGGHVDLTMDLADRHHSWLEGARLHGLDFRY